MDVWKLDESISNFKGAWSIYFYFISYRNTCMQTVEILIICHVLRGLIKAYTIFLCPFLQDTMHKCAKQCPRNVTLYTEKEMVRKDKIEPYVLWPERNFLFILTQ